MKASENAMTETTKRDEREAFDEVEEVIRKHFGTGEVAKYREAIDADERNAFLQWAGSRPYFPSSHIVGEVASEAWQAACAWQRAESAKACDSVVDQSKNSLFRSGAKICAGTIRSMSSNQTERCDRPPEGWHCTRAAGHSGPCAAFDAEEFQTLLGYDDSGKAVFGTDPDAHAALAAPPPASTNGLTPEWLWHELMDYCKASGRAPSEMNRLFEIVKRARAIIAATEGK